jgi:hypothetical protein
MDTNKKPINHQISHDFHKITKKYLTAESAEIAEFGEKNITTRFHEINPR